MIYEHKFLFSMDLATLIDKLLEHEIELNYFSKSEEGNNKNKGLKLKVTYVKDMKLKDENY